MGNLAVKGSNLSAYRGLKNDCSEIESLWYVAVRLFVHMYHHFVVVVLLNCKNIFASCKHI